MAKLKLDDGEQEGFDILCGVIPEDLVLDIIRLRRRKKAHMTKRIADRLVSEYKAFGNPEKAAEIHLMRGWVSFESDWAKKPGRFTDQHHPTPRASANYGNPSNDTTPVSELTPEQKANRERLARMARETAQRMRATA